MTRVVQGILWVLSLGVALVSWRFLAGGVELTMPFVAYHLEGQAVALYAHIGLAPLVLALVPLQFSSRVRARRPGLHRWSGRVYALGCLASGIAGLVLALHTEAGALAAWGFGLLAVVWLGVTAQAVRFAMTRQITQHRRWMIRSAALTLAAVTLRLYLPIGSGTIGFDASYPFVAWLCWVPNLLVAEWWLRHERQGPSARAS